MTWNRKHFIKFIDLIDLNILILGEIESVFKPSGPQSWCYFNFCNMKQVGVVLPHILDAMIVQNGVTPALVHQDPFMLVA